jgi:very-short-patch-repair endonuclease
MTEENVSQRYDELAARQHGVVGVRQLYELGLSDDWVGRRVGAGWLHRVHRGVYAVGNPRLSARGLFMAAALACGPTAVISHSSAAALSGIVNLKVARPTEKVHVSVTARGGRSRPGLALHRRDLSSGDVTTQDGIPVTTVGLTLLDLAGQVRGRALERAAQRAIYLGLIREAGIDEVLGLRGGQRGARELRRAIGSSAGGRARTRLELERRFLALCSKHRLPQPLVNAPVHGLTVDFVWEAAKLVVETDGRGSHATRRAFQDDRDRDSLLAAHGYLTLRFTWFDVTRRPGVVAHRLRRVLAARTE